MKLRPPIIARLAVMAALAAAPLASPAQTVLRAADSLPVGHFFAEQGLKFWLAEVRRQTGNAIDIQHFPAEQLGKAKDMLQLAMTGVADIAYVVPSYVSDRMPLMTVSELPGLSTTSCQGTEAFMKLVRGGVLEQKEMAPNGVVVLFSAILDPYQAYATRRIESLDSLKGMKLRTAGGAQAALVRALGGVPVNMAAPETYEALSRGTIDGVIFPAASLIAYDLASRLKGATQDVSFGTVVLTYAMSRKRFDQLPENVRAAMLKAGDAAARNVCTWLDSSGASNKAKITAAGVTYTALGDADRKRLAEASDAVNRDWAQQLDKRGNAGSEVLEAYVAATRR
jgi:TRAP-type C4-dicarboxylate transport system substrate-binding protein